ncbi:PAS domain S-box protein [Candidatus Kuenenia sp.]|uniref:PAS domain S-box protein n=1 Tax=Candidatus Kuenenia sp. TaxID=2499824 RepID=UPI00322027A4
MTTLFEDGLHGLNKEHLSKLIHSIEHGSRSVIITDAEGCIQYVNPAFAKITGYTKEEAIGKNPRILKSGETPHGQYKQLWETIASGNEWEGEFHNRKKNGEYYWVFATISPMKNEEGTVTHFIGIQREITERKRKEVRFNAFVKNTADALIAIDEQGVVELFNPAAEKMFGYKKEEVVGQNVIMLMPESYRKKHEDGLKGYLNTGKARILGTGPIELEALRKDGTAFPIELTIGDARLDEYFTFIGIIRDITERKWAEQKLMHSMEELSRSNAELQQFAYVASHDLQEPLRMITSYTKLLERRYKDKLDSNANEYIAFAVDGAMRMQQLINDLLAYSRVTSRTRNFEPVDCTEVFNRVAKNLKIALEESGAAITHDHLPVVMADPSQLTQLFQNLIGNALKFRGEAPPHVHISAEKKESEWIFAVSDNGIGIDPQYYDRIFIVFQRLHGKEDYPGSGIGLSICKKIVERHSGRIWLKSEQGKGATFYFSLPVRN